MIKMSKKQGLMIALSALVAGFSVAGCSTGDSKDPGTSVAGDETTGKMGLNLTLSNGVLIEAFTATITGDAIAAPIVRTIPVPNNGATVSALFGGLPQGDYEIELAATSVDGNSQCGGSADFTVIAQQAVGVSVPITCNTDSIRGQVNVEGEFNVCPDVDFLFVAPLQTAVGGPISVEAHASDSDGDTITYAWTATDGEFDATDVASATYTCSAPGEQTITVAINDGGSCTTTHQAVVNCEPTAVCGDGNVETDKGEECDPPDGTTCSSTCQDIVVECGNGIVQPGEECDGGSDCNASCQEIECGDGRVDAPQESCDQPGNFGTSAGQCRPDCSGIVPAVCGNGIVEAGEDCDDPSNAACVNCQIDDSAACTACQAANCSGPVGREATACAGTTCDALYACIEASGCADSGDSQLCYCGSADKTACLTASSYNAANQAGPCVTEIVNLALPGFPIQFHSPSSIAGLWFDNSTPLGPINQVYDCSISTPACADVCF